MSSCFWKNGIGVHTAELSLILCQKYAMCHVCLWFVKKWLKKCISFDSQHWKSIFWLAYSWSKIFTRTKPWGSRPCWKRVTKTTNLRTWTVHYLDWNGVVWWGPVRVPDEERPIFGLLQHLLGLWAGQVAVEPSLGGWVSAVQRKLQGDHLPIPLTQLTCGKAHQGLILGWHHQT